MKIYTKSGDQGSTSLFGGRRVSKSHLRLDAYGAVDEVNALLGVVDAAITHEELRSWIREIQRDLFVLGADLATPHDATKVRIDRMEESSTLRLEALIDRLDAELPQIRFFILPGGHAAAAHLHVARTVCRRAERCMVALAEQESVTPHALVYINRLSDALFVLARFANHLHGISDIPWKSTP